MSNRFLNHRKEFESNLDIKKTITICRDLCRIYQNHDDELEDQAVANRFPDSDPFQQLFNNHNIDMNSDIRFQVKTIVMKLIRDNYNRFTIYDGHCNAYITCPSTGKAAVAIHGTTVHTSLKITLSKLLLLSVEVAHQYRALFNMLK